MPPLRTRVRTSLIAVGLLAVTLSGCEDDGPYGGIELEGDLGVPIAAERQRGLTLVEASVNGGEPGWFVVDTGAQLVMLDLDLAARVGIEEPSRLDRLELGDVAFRNVRAAPFDLAPFEAVVGVDLDGLLGESLLRYFTLVVDPRAERVTILDLEDELDSGLLEDVEATAHVVALTRSYGLPIGQTSFEGSAPVAALFDTGASVTIVTERFSSELGPRPRFPTLGGVGASGTFAVDHARICGASVGTASVGDLLVGVVPDSALSDLELLSPSPRVIFGTTLFQEFTTVFDGPSDELRLYRYVDRTHVHDPSYVRVGVIVARAGEAARVTRVIEGSDAEAQGLTTDDLITALDGVAVAALDDDALDAALRGAPGDTVLIEHRREESDEMRETPVLVEDLLPACR